MREETLFVGGEFTAHSGDTLPFKIECDALTTADMETLANIVSQHIQFSEVHGVPEGGLPFAKALEQQTSSEGEVLIVDDVLTTGASMEEMKEKVGGNPVGVVIFARGPCPGWVKPILKLSNWTQK